MLLGWLNMIEFPASVCECLHRRIPSFDTLKREVLTSVEACTAKAILITWRFSLDQA